MLNFKFSVVLELSQFRRCLILKLFVIMRPSTGKSLALKCLSIASQNKSSICPEIPLRNTNQSANEQTGVLLDSNIGP